ncbi:GMC family oxidoreductase [Aminobacter sp. HY435]|uniref:GMC family oxidoreductase n=1 Tax=Aminobacter sp. HY435 TaxID=2970917 RepID=UPI0022B99DC6|nr:GMC family oxidoreductase N-terminal domain-containing protein [Aminobacter sp. HY435]
MSEFDTIIVGAGSAGCVLAARLSEDPAHRVLLLEAGPSDLHPLVRMPRGWVKLTKSANRSWNFPVEHASGRPRGETWARGRGLGGSSSINGMLYCRGAPEDYDGWRQFGVNGWDWSDMAPVFHRMENRQLGGNDLRGGRGPLQVSMRPLANPLGQAILDAGVSYGLRTLDDLNGPSREGIGTYEHTVGHDGRRMSAARAFLHPALSRNNLTVMTTAQATRIVFEGRRAVGVEFLKSGHRRIARARSDVIVACGAIQSPQLLQVSGVGPADVLAAAGVDKVAVVPGVGRNFAEHLVVALPYRLAGLEGHNPRLRGLRLIGEVLRYYLCGSGLMSFGASEMGGFVRSSPQVAYPDIQLSLSPYTFARGLLQGKLQLEDKPGLTIIGYALRPESRGEIAIRTSDMRDLPRIRPNWLATEADARVAVSMMRIMRELVAQPALRPYVKEEIWPGAGVQSDAALLDAFRGTFVSGLHATGTCRMGTDAGAVVDERLRVHGVEGLRVVDASAIPAPISGNTNGPVMALAWRAADRILEDRR